MRVPPQLLTLDPPAGALAAGAAAASADCVPGWPASPILALLLLAVAVAAWAGRLARRHAAVRAETARVVQALDEARTWAGVGHEVAAVTHRLANAVAIVRANVRWLGEEPPPRDEAERAERVQVVEETLAAAERVAAIAAQLRRLADEARTASAPAPPAADEPETPGR